MRILISVIKMIFNYKIKTKNNETLIKAFNKTHEIFNKNHVILNNYSDKIIID